MAITRRSFVLFSLCAAAQKLLGQQGIATRDIKAQPKPAPSGRPFNAHFTDVAQAAGLRAPVIYGGRGPKKYILEATGCGCAFIDYDNDGWMDIFLLSGTRLEGDPPEATNRLYKNNRDGTFTDVTEKAGLSSGRLGERRVHRRLQQRRLRRHLLHLLRTESALSQQRRWNFYRCDQEGRALLERVSRAGAPDALFGLQPRRPSRSVRLQLHSISISSTLPRPGRTQLQLERCSGQLRAARTCPRAGILFIATTAMGHLPM